MLLSTARELHLATLFYCGREKDGVQPFEDEEKSSRYQPLRDRIVPDGRALGSWLPQRGHLLEKTAILSQTGAKVGYTFAGRGL